jgi:type VI secretion system protein ImpC
MTRSDTSVLAVLGDFAGDAGGEIESRKIISVDLDTLDSAIRRQRPEIRLDLPYCPSLRFSSWRDFHPDSIAERTPSLQALLYARDEVGNLSVMKQHLAEAGVPDVAETSPARAPAAADPSSRAPDQNEGGLLDSILGDESTGEAAGGSGRSSSSAGSARTHGSGDPEFDRMIRSIVDESADSQDFAGEHARRAAIDGELSRRMREILHHPRFQSLEASWSGVRNLIRAGASDPDRLRIRILDLRKDEVAAIEIDELESSPLYALICGATVETPGAERFSALLTDFEIGDDGPDLRVAAILAALAARAAAPLLAAASSQLALPGYEGSEAWRALSASPLGEWISLSYPRVLIRLPYGNETDPIDAFDFDEFAGSEGSEGHLWGSPALLAGRMLAGAIVKTGVISDFRHFAYVEDLPVHVVRQSEEIESVGPMQTLLTEPQIAKLNDRGITAVVGRVGGDGAEIVGLRAVSGHSLFG